MSCAKQQRYCSESYEYVIGVDDLYLVYLIPVPQKLIKIRYSFFIFV